MTELEDQLREAGTRWRTEANRRMTDLNVNTSPNIGQTRRAPARRRWAPAVATAVVLALVVGTVVLLQRIHSSNSSQPAHPTATFTLPTDVRAMAVHDGDRVRAIGQIVDSNVGPLLCTHVASADAAGSSADSPKYGCGSMTIARLTGTLPAADGSSIELTGTYRNGTIAVDQFSPTTSDYAVAGVVDATQQTPCAAPVGGWKSPDGTANYPDNTAVLRYLQGHDTLIAGYWLSTPDPNHKLPSAEGGTRALQILAIGVAGSPAQVAQVRADLTPRYAGELCVYPAPFSYRDQNAAGKSATTIVGAAIIQPGHDNQVGREYIEVKRLSEDQAARLAALGSVLQVYPHVWPVG